MIRKTFDNNNSWLRRNLLNIGLFTIFAITGCGMLKPKENPSNLPDIAELTKEPLSPEESQELLGEVGRNFVYGEGLGCSMINIGSIVLFPPYAALVLGNAALGLNGYEEYWPSDLLPEQDREEWRGAYSEICSVPGRINADLYGEEFRSKEEARRRIEKFLKERESRKHG